jgi:hypothetical protein
MKSEYDRATLVPAQAGRQLSAVSAEAMALKHGKSPCIFQLEWWRNSG